MGLTIDSRLPALVEITEPTRQQTRRTTRKRTPCAKCRRPLTAEDLCLADGRFDCHRWCAEAWNSELFDAWDELRAQDVKADAEDRAKALGLAVPSGGGLWTPSAHRPRRTPAAAAAAL